MAAPRTLGQVCPYLRLIDCRPQRARLTGVLHSQKIRELK